MSSLFLDVAWNRLVVHGDWQERPERGGIREKITNLHCATYQKRADPCSSYMVPDI
jgi:hypothetical protein